MGMADMWTAWAGIAVKKAHPLASDRLLVSALMSAHAPPPLGLLLFLNKSPDRATLCVAHGVSVDSGELLMRPFARIAGRLYWT